jgi:hypothetical protein
MEVIYLQVGPCSIEMNSSTVKCWQGLASDWKKNQVLF